MNKKEIIIIPGSYKPPNKDHLRLIENIIKNNNNIVKIIIIISKKPRTLDKRLQFYEYKSKDELQKVLIETFPNNNILELKKDQLINKIDNYIDIHKLQTINANQSLKVWNIYIKYLKNKYNNNIPKIIVKIAENNNVIKDTAKIMLQLLRENRPTKIILMKCEKNRDNKRFNFLLKGSLAKYIDISIFPNIKDLDSRDMREAILNKDIIIFNKYLPRDLDDKDRKRIWNIVNNYKFL
jgi:phosphopantetheine adenylyltransferase